MKKQPEVTEQTKKNIIAAFCDLYRERPIEKIHVKDVIAAAGYNRSTFYEYFQDIYALLIYIEDDVIHYIKKGLNSGTHTQTDLLRLLSEKEQYLKVLLGPFGGVHFQDRLMKELLPEREETINNSPLQSYISEFHMTISLSMYRLLFHKFLRPTFSL
jgi:AcrR family transcriptional regulator